MSAAHTVRRPFLSKSARHQNRRGTVLVMAAALMVALVGCLALAVDVGYLCMTCGQLQRAADAGALAGATALYDTRKMRSELHEYRYTIIPPRPDTARREVGRFIGFNPAAARDLQVDANPANLIDGEIVLGSRSINAAPLIPTLDKPDSVLVRLPLREGHANGAVQLFFARVWGLETANLGASAMATVKHPGGLLPFGISETKWDSLGAGGDGDHFAYGRGDGDFGVTGGADGVPEIVIFPGDWNGEGMPPGNFGLLFIGNHQGGPSVIGPQINRGVSESDLDFHGGVLRDGMDVPGKTGLKSGNKHALLGHPNYVDNVGDSLYDGIVGQFRYIAVYDSATGNGSNSTFTVSKFVMVRIMAIQIDGSTRIDQYDTEGSDITGFVVQPLGADDDLLEIALTL